MFEQVGPEPATTAARVVEYLKTQGASVGLDDVVKTTGYGLAGVSGHAAAGTMALANVNALARELYNEAIEKFGSKIVHSKSTNHMAKMQNFLKGHPKYAKLMRHMQELPKHLLPKGIPLIPERIRSHVSAARHFRKHIALPFKKWNNSSRYVNSVAKQLNGRLSFFKRAGKFGTWYIPATLGIISVATAPPELKMRTVFEEGFGILGGALGTWFGGTAVAAGAIGLFTLCGLCLGPFGLFITVFICASVGGVIGMEIFKKGGAAIYDFGTQLDNDRIYHSPDQLLEIIK